ncbi:MAG TPA: PEGA domain-containing protein [Methanospirillum sp.]|uniref:PEGA domain-containing protein n=1 Tax=Methanospirillum sp. TaxID=45200 RepID=UPI002D009D37|nr:PEGA domain-containing protein [Methanospirillum sp.]HWQ64068.1 PEGA domain-containing protein [Methanospirillum sp.]
MRLWILVLLICLIVSSSCAATTNTSNLLLNLTTNITPVISQVPVVSLSTTTQTTTVPTSGPTTLVTQVPTTAEPTKTPTKEITLIPTLKPIKVPVTIPKNPAIVPNTTITPAPATTSTLLPTLEPTIKPVISLKPALSSSLVTQGLSPITGLSLSGNFSFISSPSGATVTFDGSPSGTTPVTLAVDESSSTPHTIKMEKSGFQDWTSSLDHNPAAGTTETITATLQASPLNGSISVSSTPSGATVAIDGSDIQTTPHTYPEVIPGSHTVTVSKDGYTPYTTPVTVASGAESVVSAVLNQVSTTGSLTVDTYPWGAAIILNGVVYGITPAHYDAIPTGTYTMQLAKFGYQPVTQTIEISSGKESKVEVALPRYFPPTGTLSIRSYPSGGVVTLDGDFHGVTPVRIHGINPGSYNVRVSIPGYLDWIGIVDVVAGRETSIYGTLTPKGTTVHTGSIALTSTPSGASVILDSRPQGITPMTLQNIPGGTHTLILTYPGYEPVTTTTTVQEGTTSQLSVSLNPYTAQNLTPGLITLSDDAAAYLSIHGRTQALTDFNNPSSGFSSDTKYVLALDLNGTVLADAANPELVGLNLSQNSNPVSTGLLVSSLAKMGGGSLYATNLTIGDKPVSLLYVRPAISGIIISAVTPVDGMVSPIFSGDPERMKESVHAAVLHAKDLKREEAEANIEADSYSSASDMLLHTFDSNSTADTDQNGVSTTSLLIAVAENGGGFVWVPMFDGSDHSILTLGYAEMVDDSWGIWASSVEKGHEIIVMMDAVPVVVSV